eukprot:scaffold3100_cov248-Pinguiococcus_pyrenoidosus.AAC.19
MTHVGVLGVQRILRLPRPRQDVVRAAARKAIVPDPHYPILRVDDTGPNLPEGARITFFTSVWRSRCSPASSPRDPERVAQRPCRPYCRPPGARRSRGRGVGTWASLAARLCPTPTAVA